MVSFVTIVKPLAGLVSGPLEGKEYAITTETAPVMKRAIESTRNLFESAVFILLPRLGGKQKFQPGLLQRSVTRGTLLRRYVRVNQDFADGLRAAAGRCERLAST